VSSNESFESDNGMRRGRLSSFRRRERYVRRKKLSALHINAGRCNFNLQI